jgi:hypothetical protein
MTVQELIEELQQYEPTSKVHFSYNYGDHWRTTVAPEARHVEELPVIESEYHRMPKVIDEDDTRYDDATHVVVIRG